MVINLRLTDIHRAKSFDTQRQIQSIQFIRGDRFKRVAKKGKVSQPHEPHWHAVVVDEKTAEQHQKQ